MRLNQRKLILCQSPIGFQNTIGNEQLSQIMQISGNHQFSISNFAPAKSLWPL